MIFTLTLNPCADHYITADGVLFGKTNRAKQSRAVFGGKGANVSLALRNLGVESKAVLFAGGFTGEGLVSHLSNENIAFTAVKTRAETRINTKIITKDGITEINAPGGEIGPDELRAFTDALDEMGADDTAVISGSVPPCAFDAVGAVLGKIGERGARLVADMHGADLKKCLSHRPYLIKPNLEEAAELFGGKADIESAEVYAKKLADHSEYVILSLGGNGAYMCGGGKTEYLPVKNPGYEVKNTVGAGDSMIAGFLYGEAHGENRLVCAVSAGSATAYSDGICDMETFEKIKKLY